MKEIVLGSKAKDFISGFEGVVTGKCIYLTGCVQYLLTPDHLDKDGKILDAQWFDDSRLLGEAQKKSAFGGPQKYAPNSESH